MRNATEDYNLGGDTPADDRLVCVLMFTKDYFKTIIKQIFSERPHSLLLRCHLISVLIKLK